MDIEAMRCHANDKNMPFGFRYQSQMGTHQIGQNRESYVRVPNRDRALEKNEEEEEKTAGEKNSIKSKC